MSRWLGHWRLLPELCHYEDGPVPREALYVIARDGELLRFTLNWIDAAGESHRTGFAAPPDGTPVPSRADDVDTFSVLADSEHVLTGEAQFQGRRVGHAVRRVSADGTLMSVLQERDFADGLRDRVFQVFQREVPHG